MGQIMVCLRKNIYPRRGFCLEQIQTKEQKIHIHTRWYQKKRINVEPSTNNHLAQARPSTATSRTRHRAATRRGVWDQKKAIDCELFTSEDVEVTDGREMSTLCLET